MEVIDHALQQRVWQRVTGNQTTAWDAQALLPLIAGVLTNRDAFLQLSRQYPGRRNALLHKLYAEQQNIGTHLKGIYRALTGRLPQVTSNPLPRLPRNEMLLQCYWRQQKNLDTLQRWMPHPAFGESFRRLYQRELTQGHILMEILGRDDGR